MQPKAIGMFTLNQVIITLASFVMFHADFDGVSDTIAIPVKRKSGKKKVRSSRRHSAFETADSKSEG
jgi:hypothetical protein